MHWIEEFFAKNCMDFFYNGPGSELLNFAAFSLNFDVRKKSFSALDRKISCLAFYF